MWKSSLPTTSPGFAVTLFGVYAQPNWMIKLAQRNILHGTERLTAPTEMVVVWTPVLEALEVGFDVMLDGGGVV